MKHLHSFRKLNRHTAHRHAMLSNMANSLLKHSRIITTLQKAKELRKVVEPLVTRAKVDTLAHRRHILSILRHPDMLNKLFTVIAPAFSQRPGGYTRIIKLGPRLLDNAERAVIEFVQNFAEVRKKPEEKKPGAAAGLPAIPEKPESREKAKAPKTDKIEKAAKPVAAENAPAADTTDKQEKNEKKGKPEPRPKSGPAGKEKEGKKKK